jgi:hypothetical protein
VTRPIDRDELLIANETTSLCMDDPFPDFRFRFQYVGDSPPGLILLSTDGYPNSFRSQDGFLQVGTDLLDILCTDGGDSVEKDLPGWLREASSGGSGDDVTLGIVYRLAPPLRRPVVGGPPVEVVPDSAQRPADSTGTPGTSEQTAFGSETTADAAAGTAGTTDSDVDASPPTTIAGRREDIAGSASPDVF